MLGGLALLLAMAVGAALAVELPYYAISPGSARPTEPAVTVSGVESFPAGEELLFTTVLVDPVNAFDLIEAWLDDDAEVVPAEEIDGDQTPSQNQRLNQQLMTASQDIAVVVALEHLGYDVVSGTGATVEGVVEDTPAEGVIEPGDTVVAAGGEPVERVEDLVAAIDARAPGRSWRWPSSPRTGPAVGRSSSSAASRTTPTRPSSGCRGCAPVTLPSTCPST